jgi:hypothetical protein
MSNQTNTPEPVPSNRRWRKRAPTRTEPANVGRLGVAPGKSPGLRCCLRWGLGIQTSSSWLAALGM